MAESWKRKQWRHWHSKLWQKVKQDIVSNTYSHSILAVDREIMLGKVVHHSPMLISNIIWKYTGGRKILPPIALGFYNQHWKKIIASRHNTKQKLCRKKRTRCFSRKHQIVSFSLCANSRRNNTFLILVLWWHLETAVIACNYTKEMETTPASTASSTRETEAAPHCAKAQKTNHPLNPPPAEQYLRWQLHKHTIPPRAGYKTPATISMVS